MHYFDKTREVFVIIPLTFYGYILTWLMITASGADECVLTNTGIYILLGKIERRVDMFVLCNCNYPYN